MRWEIRQLTIWPSTWNWRCSIDGHLVCMGQPPRPFLTMKAAIADAVLNGMPEKEGWDLFTVDSYTRKMTQTAMYNRPTEYSHKRLP